MNRWIFALPLAVCIILGTTADPLAPEQKASGWLPKFSIATSPIELTRPVRSGKYFEAIGRHSAVIGEEQGIFEVWVYPFKILHSFKLSIVLEGESRIYDARDLAERITVRPEAVTITYVADEFTLSQHLVAPIDERGAIMLLDVDADRLLSIVCSLSPALEPMWPGGLGGQYSYWDDEEGAFVITESRKEYSGAVGCPLGEKGSSTPAHELPEGEVQFEVAVHPDSAHGFYIPIVIAGGVLGVEEVKKTYRRMLGSIGDLYGATRSHYDTLRRQFLSLQTDNKDIDLAFEWAKVAIDKGFACNPHLGCGLVAGFGHSGASERPGFAWYFGGDAFMNSFAINSYGDFATTRQALTFLRQYQRDDGKMMHELSQSGGMIPWFEEYPYCYYHADTTPYYIVAARDYIRATNDTAFLRETWDSVKKAYGYCLDCDTDGDGLMENSKAGLGAVELGSLLKRSHTDIYLAGIWVEAIRSLSEMARIMDEIQLAEESSRLFEKARHSLNEKFWNEEKGTYNFALTTDDGVNDEVTAWPAVPLLFGLLDEQRAASMLDVLASSELSTDWGVRMLSNRSEAYQPLSYNNGAVWPFLTGYAAWAEYLGHRPFSGFMHLMNMVRLTFIDALGYNPELLSGDRYKPLRTGVPHQIFSSSFVVTSTVRGLLGLEGDGEQGVITFSPHLPPDWNHLSVRSFRVGEATFFFRISVKREEGQLVLSMRQSNGEGYRIIFSPAFGPATEIREVTLDGQKVDYRLFPTRGDIHCQVEFQPDGQNELLISFAPGIELNIPEHAPQIGARSSGLRIVDSCLEDDEYIITTEGHIEKVYEVRALIPFSIVSFEGCGLPGRQDIGEGRDRIRRLIFGFQEGEEIKDGYMKRQIRIKIEL